MKQRYLSIIKNSIMGTCIAWTLCMQYGVAEYSELENVEIANAFFRGCYNLLLGLSKSVGGQFLMSSLLCITFTYCLYQMEKKLINKTNLGIGQWFLAFFLALFYTAALSIRLTGTCELLNCNASQMAKSIIMVTGYTLLYGKLFTLLRVFLFSKYDVKISKFPGKKLYEKHPYSFRWCAIFFSYGLHVFIKFPGAMTLDNWGQITQYYGLFPMYTHWPPFHTCLLGWFIKTGEQIHSTNLGLFAYVVMQWLTMTSILSYSLTTMKKFGAKRWLRVLNLFIYCSAPFYTGYVAVTEKDVLFGMFVLLFVIEMIYILFATTEFNHSARHLCLMSLSIAMIILFRKNGIYLVVPTVVILAVYVLCHIKKETYLAAVKLAVLILPIFAAVQIEEGLVAKHEMRPGSMGEMFSIPFQQTARYMRYYGTEITEEEWQVICTVFNDSDRLGEEYNPVLSDPVKGKFIQETSKEDLRAYFCVWLQQGLRYPGCYIESVLSQSYPLFCLDVEHYSYFRDFHMAGEDRIAFQEISWLQGPQDAIISWYKFYHSIPVIGLFNNMAFYCILLLVVIWLTIHTKNWKLLIALIPAMLSLLILFAGPATLGFVRYAFPIVFTIPFMVGIVEGQRKHEIKEI